MKKYNQKNRQSRNQKPQQNRMPVPEDMPIRKLLAEIQITSDEMITIPRAEYDMLVDHAHLVNVTEVLCKCSSQYTAATFLRHMIANFTTDELDEAPGKDAPVTLDRAEYDSLNRTTGLLNALVDVSKRGPNYNLSNMLEMLFCQDETGKVKEE